MNRIPAEAGSTPDASQTASQPSQADNVLFQHVAGFSRLNEPLGVLLEKKTLIYEFVGGLLDRLHIAVMVLVALLERLARVTACQPFRFGLREGDVGAVQPAQVGSAESGCPDVPAG